MYAAFVLVPLLLTLQYSLYRWDGIGPSDWVGLRNYVNRAHRPGPARGHRQRVQADRLLLASSRSALGLLVASVMRRVATGRFGTASRTVLFLPQIIPLVAAGIAWKWVLSTIGRGESGPRRHRARRHHAGLARRLRHGPPRRRDHRRLGADRAVHRPAAHRHEQDRLALYESARHRRRRGDARSSGRSPLPSLRQEIGVCITVTMIAALARFDIVYIATGGGPGGSTAVPGLEIYQLAFAAGRSVWRRRLPSCCSSWCWPASFRSSALPGGASRDRPAARGHDRAGCCSCSWSRSRSCPSSASCRRRCSRPTRRRSGSQWPSDPQWGNFVDAFNVAQMPALLSSSVTIVLGRRPDRRRHRDDGGIRDRPPADPGRADPSSCCSCSA